ncbi:hypothetical protein REPUB_Repub06bG0132300 [Reevesia pubescens]
MVLGNELYEVARVDEEDITTDLDVLELNTEDEVNRIVKDHSLVGKVVFDKHIKTGHLRAVISKAWLTKNPIEVHDLDRNIFLFVFKEENDRRKILS